MTTKLEALCQVADAYRALQETSFSPRKAPALKLGYDDLQQLAAEIRELQQVLAQPIPADAVTAIVAGAVKRGSVAFSDAGWIEWNGGECPVDPAIRVDVKLRDGFHWNNTPASLPDWTHAQRLDDVVAYRLAAMEQAPIHTKSIA
jgi:hypothetical protein